MHLIAIERCYNKLEPDGEDNVLVEASREFIFNYMLNFTWISIGNTKNIFQSNFMPLVTFYTPWKHQRNRKFSVVQEMG